MKKLIGILLALAMLLSLGASALAAAEPQVVDRPLYGLHIVIPESYRNLKGLLDLSGSAMDDYDPGIFYQDLYYYALNEEQLPAFNAYIEAYVTAVLSGAEPPAPEDPRWDDDYLAVPVFTIYGINGGRGQAGREAALKAYYPPENMKSSCPLEDLGQRGDTHFYLAQYILSEQQEAACKETMGEFYQEYIGLRADKESFVNALTLSEPQKPKTLEIGDLVSFEAAYLDGTPVTSAELFKNHDVTMINLWATWCGPCKRELPELAKLGDELEAKNCQLIGICLDAGEEGNAQLAQSILDEAGVHYTNLIAPKDADDLFPFASIPASLFVDSEGRILTAPVVGAYVDQYPGRIDEALKLVAASKPASEPAAEAVIESAPAAEEAAPVDPEAAVQPVEEAVPAVEAAASDTAAVPIVEEIAPAPAEAAPAASEPAQMSGEWVDFPAVGVSMVLPASFANLNGTLSLSGIDLGSGRPIYEMQFDYTAVPMSRYEELYNALFVANQALPEEISEYLRNNARVFSVFCVGDGVDYDALARAYEEYYDIALNEELVEKIALADGYTYYLCRHYANDGKALPDGVYSDELRLVCDNVDNIVSSMTFQKPLV